MMRLFNKILSILLGKSFNWYLGTYVLTQSFYFIPTIYFQSDRRLDDIIADYSVGVKIFNFDFIYSIQSLK